MAKTVSIDVIDKSVPSDNTRNIPIINQPNPCKGYAATAKEVAQLIQLASYYVYATGTTSVIDGYTFYDYFPEEGGSSGGGGSGLSKTEIQAMIDASIPTLDTAMSSTSRNGVENRVIKEFVNSSIASSTGTFRGTFDSVDELNAYSGEKKNNDYAYVVDKDASGITLKQSKYKYVDESTAWVFEYVVNDTTFTAAQLASINSGITNEDVAKITSNETAIKELNVTVTNHEDTIAKSAEHIIDKKNPHEVTKAQIGLGDVDNTSDMEKPISTLTQEALDKKLDTDSDVVKNSHTHTNKEVIDKLSVNDNDELLYHNKKIGIDPITVDTELSETSTNPVENKAVTTKINEVESKIPTDVSALTNDSEYQTKSDVTTLLEGYAKTTDIPTVDVTKEYVDEALKGKSDVDHTHTTVNGHTVESDVPVDAKFTDTVYDDTALKELIDTKLGSYATNESVETHTSNNDIHVTTDEKTSWNNAATASHTHDNKSVLDGITEEKLTAYDKAVTDDHTHANKSVIDKLSADSTGNLLYDGKSIESGFGGRLADLFLDDAEWSTIGSDDTLLSLAPGIYEVPDATTRRQLGIADLPISSGPPGIDFDEYRAPGGLLFKSGNCLTGKGLNCATISGGRTYRLEDTRTPMALFIDKQGYIYTAVGSLKYDSDTSTTVINSLEWRGYDYTKYPINNKTVVYGYIHEDTTATEDSPVLLYNLNAQLPYPYTSATVMGPDQLYNCTIGSGTGTAKGVYITSGTAKAGMYIIELT